MPKLKGWPNVFCKTLLIVLSGCSSSSSPEPISEAPLQGDAVVSSAYWPRDCIQESESLRKAFLRYVRPRVGWLRIKANYQYRESRLEGTAWYWEGHGVWVTCAHLFPQDSPKNLEIELWDVEGRCRVLSPPWREDSLDVAFLRDTQRVGLVLAKVPPEEGDWCFTVGAPLGLSFSFQEGYVVAERRIESRPYYQLSLWAAPGSSGSPVLSRTGHLTAMITEVAGWGSGDLGIAFALPASRIWQAYERYLTFAAYDTARAQ
jgi:hypothetical protein